MNKHQKAHDYDDLVSDIATALECRCAPKGPLSMGLTIYNRATQGEITTVYDPSGAAGLVGTDPTTEHPLRGPIVLGLPLVALAQAVASEQKQRSRT